jgi:hypothetical protein
MLMRAFVNEDGPLFRQTILKALPYRSSENDHQKALRATGRPLWISAKKWHLTDLKWILSSRLLCPLFPSGDLDERKSCRKHRLCCTRHFRNIIQNRPSQTHINRPSHTYKTGLRKTPSKNKCQRHKKTTTQYGKTAPTSRETARSHWPKKSGSPFRPIFGQNRENGRNSQQMASA